MMLAVTVTLTVTTLCWIGGTIGAIGLWIVTRKIGRRVRIASHAKQERRAKVATEARKAWERYHREEYVNTQKRIALRKKMLPGEWYGLYTACLNVEPQLAFSLIHKFCQYRPKDGDIIPAAADALLRTVIDDNSIRRNIAATLSEYIKIESGEYTQFPRKLIWGGP